MTEFTPGLEQTFRAHKHELQQRVGTIEAAVAAIGCGELDAALRTRAEHDAHTLAGSLATFGLLRGSELAHELGDKFASGLPELALDLGPLSACVITLRTEIDAAYARLEGHAPSEPRDAPLFGSEAAGEPVVPPERSVLEADARRQLRGEMLENGLSRTEPAEFTSGRILVVDDDAAVRDAIVAILCDAGYDANGVGSAREARYELANNTIPLLLSDVSMPGETGLDLIRFALCEHPETATLLISGLEDPGIAQVALDFGAFGYLTKPVRRSAVVIGVMNALRRRDAEARERAARVHLEDILRLRTGALNAALECLEEAAAQSRVLQAETIHRWAQSAEHRDPGIARHLKRVGHYCAVLGQEFGLHAQSVELASVLHDVGKIAIPDSILLKAGPLTAEERLAVETHTSVGHDLLRGSCSGLLDLAAVIAKTHHEKFDGTGYPCGLSGTEIPLEGRIAAVADVFDGLTSDGMSGQAWSLDASVAWMTRERGRHFDPEVIDAFLSSMDEIRSVQSLMTF